MSEREWFAPKRFGYGASLPIAWQGWVVTAVYLALIVLALFLFRNREVESAAIVLPATAAFILVAARTTKGGWRWRWGDDE